MDVQYSQNEYGFKIDKGKVTMLEMEKDKAIGVFDSGIGGLTVVREIMRNIPDERIIYFGDTARLPYGNKSRETIIRFSRDRKSVV